MNIEITEQVDNALFARKDVKFVLRHDGETTPSRQKMRELVASAIGAKADAVVIDHMESATGFAATRGVARAYQSKAEARKRERKHFLERNNMAGGDEEAAPAKKEAPAKEEAPTEEAA